MEDKKKDCETCMFSISCLHQKSCDECKFVDQCQCSGFRYIPNNLDQVLINKLKSLQDESGFARPKLPN